MPEEVLFKTEKPRSRSDIAETLVAAAEQTETGMVQFEGTEQEETVTIPEKATFEFDLE